MCLGHLSFTVSESLVIFMSVELVMVSNHLILCCPLLLLPSVFPRIFPSESALCIRWPRYWRFSFSINPSDECSGLISFKIDWFDLLVVQGALKSLLQHHSSKASILWCSAFFMVWLPHLYMTTGKTIALTLRTFVGKVMSRLFNTLSRFVIAFLSKSKCLLLSHKKSEIMPFAATWIVLEIIVLSEISQRQISYDNPYMWNPKKWYEWTYVQNKNRVIDLGNKIRVTKGNSAW